MKKIQHNNQCIYTLFFSVIFFIFVSEAEAWHDLFEAFTAQSNVFSTNRREVIKVSYDSNSPRFRLNSDNTAGFHIISARMVIGLLNWNRLESSPEKKADLYYFDQDTPNSLNPKSVAFEFESNEKLLEAQHAVHSQLYGTCTDAGKPLKSHRFKVIWNPMSGQRRGREIKDQICHNLKSLGAQTSEYETDATGQYLSYIAPANCNSTTEWIIVGGDGTLREVVSHILENNIGTAHLERIILIPAGTGNGIAISLGIGNSTQAFQSALRALNHDQQDSIGCQLHIKKYTATWPSETETGYLLLSLTAGIIADVDIGTEWLRKLGDCRFKLGGLWHALRRKSYSFELNYNLASDYATLQHREPLDYTFVTAMNVPYAAADFMLGPGAKPESESLKLITLSHHNAGWMQRRISLMNQMADGSYTQNAYIRSNDISSLTINNSGRPRNRIVIDGELIHRPGAGCRAHIQHPDSVVIKNSGHSIRLLNARQSQAVSL